MSEQDLVEKAREWIKANTPIRWRSEPEHGVSIEELNRRPELYVQRMADFAKKVRDEALSTANAKLAIAQEALVHYADESNWLIGHDSVSGTRQVYAGIEWDGFTCAATAISEIEKVK